jgi:hypothetical protein
MRTSGSQDSTCLRGDLDRQTIYVGNRRRRATRLPRPALAAKRQPVARADRLRRESDQQGKMACKPIEGRRRRRRIASQDIQRALGAVEGRVRCRDDRDRYKMNEDGDARIAAERLLLRPPAIDLILGVVALRRVNRRLLLRRRHTRRGKKGRHRLVEQACRQRAGVDDNHRTEERRYELCPHRSQSYHSVRTR